MADYATLLRDHVTLTCRSVDRIFLQAYAPTERKAAVDGGAGSGGGRPRLVCAS